MKNIGEELKKAVETKGLKKRDIANEIGISYTYMSSLFKHSTMDCDLLERLCKVIGISPCSMFDDYVEGTCAPTSDGSVSVSANEYTMLREQLAEKERTIQILLAASGLKHCDKNATK